MYNSNNLEIKNTSSSSNVKTTSTLSNKEKNKWYNSFGWLFLWWLICYPIFFYGIFKNKTIELEYSKNFGNYIFGGTI